MDKTTLKSWFTRGKKPTAAQFATWMDSYWHKDEKPSISDIDNLPTVLNAKQNTLTFDTTPTEGSTNAVESNGIYEAIANISVQLDLSDITLTASNFSAYYGKVFQHTGSTSDAFIKGAFYIAESNSTLYRFRQISSIPSVKNITCSGEYAAPETQLIDFGLSPQKITAISYQRVIPPLAESEATACVLACTNLTNLPETGELVLIIDNNATKADTVAEGYEQTYTGVPLNVTLPTTLTGYTIVNMANLTTIAVGYRKSLEVHFLVINNTVRITLISQG